LVYNVMTNSTQTDGRTGSAKSGTIVVAIIVPSILILVLLVLIFMSVLESVHFRGVQLSKLTNSNRRRGFIIPRLMCNESTIREEKWQSRQNELDSHIKSQDFHEWLASQKEKNPTSLQITDPLW